MPRLSPLEALANPGRPGNVRERAVKSSSVSPALAAVPFDGATCYPRKEKGETLSGGNRVRSRFQEPRAQPQPDRPDGAAEADLVLDGERREDVRGEGHARGELPELHSHPGEDRVEQPLRVRHERLQADVPRLHGARGQLLDSEGEGRPGAVPLRPAAQQHLRLRGRRAVHRHGRRFRRHGPHHLQGAAADRAVRLDESER